jgi:hypothetical protein
MATKGVESEKIDEFINYIDGALAEHGVAIPADSKNVEEFTKEEQKRIIHKVDRRLVTGLGLLMGMCLMDRTNLGSTSIAGYAPLIRTLFLEVYNQLTDDTSTECRWNLVYRVAQNM